jgi:hypothetical protein
MRISMRTIRAKSSLRAYCFERLSPELGVKNRRTEVRLIPSCLAISRAWIHPDEKVPSLSASAVRR